ncbi:MAG TPA: glycosyltransferase family 39 protein [Candidatus Limnocylindrales bacterium]|nr:glycosyltransferase family 39 protein [Candidatus Limnocylindrales bacterium]
MGVLQGVFSPHFADWPHLYFYIAAAWLLPLKTLGLVQDQGSAYLAVRCLDALIGALTVGLVYEFGRRAYGRLAGLFAAAAVAVAFLHVRDSHFATLDIPLTLACLAGLYAAFLFTAGRSSVPWMGALLGVSASIKYNGALILTGIAAAQGVRDRMAGRRPLPTFRRVALCALIGLGVFFLGSPYLILDWGTTVHGVTYVFYHLQRQTAPQVGWIRMPIALWYGLDPPLALVTAAGVIVALIRRTPADWILLVFAASYYLLIGSGHSVFFRYVDPLIPPLMLLGGRALGEALRLLPPRRFIRPAYLSAAAALVLIPASIHDLRYDQLIAQPDTRALAYDWLQAHMPPGGLAAAPYLEGGVHDQAMIDAGTHSHGATTAYIASFLDGRLTTRYRVRELTAEDLQSSSTAALEAMGVRYALIAYQRPDQGCTVSSPLERALAAQGPPVASFRPAPGCPSSVFDVIDSYYVPVSGYDRWHRPGPFIRIYQVTAGP